MKEKFKKALSVAGRVLSIALVIIEVLIIVFLVASKVQGNPPTVFGYQMYFIRTGSMEPYLEPGDIIISKKLGFDNKKKSKFIFFIDGLNETTNKNNILNRTRRGH